MAHASYGGVVWFDPGSPASDAALQAIEREVGRQLPGPYVELLRTANGGTLEYRLRLPDGTETAFVDWYRAKEPGKDNYGTVIGVWRLLQEAYFHDELPAVFVPIARTGGEDDTLLLDLTPDRYGHVLAWVSGAYQGWGLPAEDALQPLASSLAEFIDQLYIDQGDVEDVRQRWGDGAAAAWLRSRAR